jgi:HD-like signal output (HDOD) protein
LTSDVLIADFVWTLRPLCELRYNQRGSRMIETARTETTGLVQQFVERTGQLFSLPAAAAEILRLTGEPRIDPRAIKKCLESDPALAARILRVVNSSLFGPGR